MRIYANNFKTKLLKSLPEDKKNCVLSIDKEIQKYLVNLLSKDDSRFFIRLTLQKEENFELIDVCQSHGILYIARCGQENTTKREWEYGTFVLCAPTAESFNTKNDNTYLINWYEDLVRYTNILEINHKNANTQIVREDDYHSFDNYSVCISQMSDGDELIVDFAGLENLDRVNILNADEVK